jgi:hypothetical protein
MFRSNFTAMSFCLIIIYMLIIAGDVELNPGPGETPVKITVCQFFTATLEVFLIR